MAQSLPDQELADRVSVLVERGHLDRGDPAYGVALAAIDLSDAELERLGTSARERVLAEHTSERRLRDFDAALAGARSCDPILAAATGG